MKQKMVTKLSDAFVASLRFGLNTSGAAERAQLAREKYAGLPVDEVAEVLIRRATSKNKWEGAVNGLAVTAMEGLLALPAPELSHKIAAGSGIAASLVGDLTFTTKVQLQLALELAALYGCPYSPDDEDDIYQIYVAALGLKGIERVAGAARFVGINAAAKQFRGLLRTGIRRAVQKRVIKLAGPQVGRRLGEKYVMRAIPVLNAAIGYGLNRHITLTVGKWSKFRAKLRSSLFKKSSQIRESNKEASILIPASIFLVGIAQGAPSQNLLTVYAQTLDHLSLSEDEIHRVEELLDSEDIWAGFERLTAELSLELEVRQQLNDIALTTAAIEPKSQPEMLVSLRRLAKLLSCEAPSAEDLQERRKYLRR